MAMVVLLLALAAPGVALVLLAFRVADRTCGPTRTRAAGEEALVFPISTRYVRLTYADLVLVTAAGVVMLVGGGSAEVRYLGLTIPRWVWWAFGLYITVSGATLLIGASSWLASSGRFVVTARGARLEQGSAWEEIDWADLTDVEEKAPTGTDPGHLLLRVPEGRRRMGGFGVLRFYPGFAVREGIRVLLAPLEAEPEVVTAAIDSARLEALPPGPEEGGASG